jgi:hypothetical protein
MLYTVSSSWLCNMQADDDSTEQLKYAATDTQ